MIKISPLPYAPGALEPFLSSQSIEIHYSIHQGYVRELNEALRGSDLAPLGERGKIAEIIRELSEGDRIESGSKGMLDFLAFQHFNHSLFWGSMTPEKCKPGKALAQAIEADLGGIVMLERVFQQVAKERPWSGWLYLVIDNNDKLNVLHTTLDFPNQDGVRTLLACDLWEHTYLFDYQSDREKWVETFFEIINWETASQLYDGDMGGGK